MMNIQQLLRPNIRSLKPYSSARDEFSGSARIFLDANENGCDWAAGNNYNRYPDPHQQMVRQKIAELKGVTLANIFLGNGSDEAIDLLIRAFCEPGVDEIIIPDPTYGMYQVSANINDVKIHKIPLTTDFQLNLASIIKAVTPLTKMIILCSPNNPTANLLNPRDVLELAASFTGITVLDEAYIDFTPDKSLLHKIKDNKRLVILQTFSKAWGLAGVRAGMAFADPAIIDALQ